MELSTLLQAVSVRSVIGLVDRQITSIEYDSRRCSPGTMFVAVRGIEADGHAWIDDAVRRGASVVVCERPVNVSEAVTVVVVENSRLALALLCHRWYGEPAKDMTIIGVTGTNGKTTTTFILKSLFEWRGEKVGLIGTTGNYIGDEVLPTAFTTPEAPELAALLARMREAGIQTVVMEVSSHGLALERVAGIRFSGAIFTNLTQDHLDFHPTMEQYAEAKKLLFDMLPPDAIALVNGDDPHGAFMIRDCSARRYVCGRAATSDIRIFHEQFFPAKTQFELAMEGREALSFTIPLIGRFNVENAAACAAYCLATGWNAEQLADAMSHIRPARGRMERIILPNGAVAVVDYAHTPDALEKALRTCRELVQPGGKLICVFGCGGDRDRTKRPMMGAIASGLADCVIVTNDNPRREYPRRIIDDILGGVSGDARVQVLEDRSAAIATAVTGSQAGDIVLIAGKGHETYQIVGDIRFHFDDCEEVQHSADVLRKQENEQRGMPTVGSL